MKPRRFELQTRRDQLLCFDGYQLARVVALNHDETVRRCFALFACQAIDGFVEACDGSLPRYVAMRVDDPDTLDERHWALACADDEAVYQFFGNEPLANYLYGCLNIRVPGLRQETAVARDV